MLRTRKFDWVCITSPESASVFLAAWRGAGRPAGLRIAVVGDGTGAPRRAAPPMFPLSFLGWPPVSLTHSQPRPADLDPAPVHPVVAPCCSPPLLRPAGGLSCHPRPPLVRPATARGSSLPTGSALPLSPPRPLCPPAGVVLTDAEGDALRPVFVPSAADAVHFGAELPHVEVCRKGAGQRVHFFFFFCFLCCASRGQGGVVRVAFRRFFGTR